MADEAPHPIADASTEVIAKSLRGLLRKGLPANEGNAGEVLPNLRSVAARSIHPASSFSRLDALNELLPRLMSQLADERFAEATQILFGLATGTRATTLTARRRQAADFLGYHVDHFRSKVEAELVQALAETIHRDLLRYQSRIKRAAESLEPTGDTPQLTENDLTHEEELISRIWQHVYGLRAELIAHFRLALSPDYLVQAEDHRQAALRQEKVLRDALDEYLGTYGSQLIRHGEAEFTADALWRLAGWAGGGVPSASGADP